MRVVNFYNKLRLNMAASVVVLRLKILCLPLPVAARSRAWVCGRSLAGIAGSNPAGDMVVS